MDATPEKLRHQLEQLRFLAGETTDPLAQRLMRDIIVQVENQLTATRESGSESFPPIQSRQ
jgi:hypothetical protein